jgi:hypothetical protein
MVVRMISDRYAAQPNFPILYREKFTVNIESMIEIRKTFDPNNLYVFVPMAYKGFEITDINNILEQLVLPSGSKLHSMWCELVNPESPIYDEQIAKFKFPLNSITYAMRNSPSSKWKIGFALANGTNVNGIVVHINKIDIDIVKKCLVKLANKYIQVVNPLLPEMIGNIDRQFLNRYYGDSIISFIKEDIVIQTASRYGESYV